MLIVSSEMGRKCSHCGNIGHNSRTCTNFRGSSAAGFVGTTPPHGFRLFGVQVHHHDQVLSSVSSFNAMNMMMKKSFSMDCLPTSSASSSSPSSSRISIDNEHSDHHKAPIGYLSDGLICRAQDRKKGTYVFLNFFLLFFINHSWIWIFFFSSVFLKILTKE